MKRRTRYLFIGFGALFFLIVAPLTVFFVGGIRYNAQEGEYARTGILSIDTDPKKADIYLDGALVETSPYNFRFLAPKEYAITLKKNGYFDWSKRLEVQASKATIASGFLDEIFLLRKDVPPQLINGGVLDYHTSDANLIYLTASSVNLVRNNNFSQTQTLALAQKYDRLIAAPHGNYLLLINNTQTQFLDVLAWRLSDVSSLVEGVGKLQVTDNGLIVGMRSEATEFLLTIDPATKNLTQVRDRVGTFTIVGTNIYYTQTQQDQTILALLPVSATAATTAQLISEQLPTDLAGGQLLITEQKDVLLLANNDLYRINGHLDPLARDIKQLHFDSINPTLLYTTASDLNWYDFAADRSHLITRSTQTITSLQLAPDIGYAFYLQDGAIKAMELDAVDHQNNYSLLSIPQGQSIRLHDNNKSLYFLEGQSLQLLKIR